MFHLKDIEYKRSAKKKELEGIISQLKEEMPLIIANVLKSMGLNSMQELTTQVYIYISV